jgi:hypothetical protein
MKLKKVSDEGNAYGFETIEIIKFNYDGKGGAICICDGEMMSFMIIDLDFILFGRPGDGQKWYKFVEV